MRTFNAGLEEVNPATLNFMEEYAGTIVNRIVDHVNHEWETTGADAEATSNKVRETARLNLDQAKVLLGAGPWMCGFGHYLGSKCLEFAERANAKKRQDADARDKWTLVSKLSMK
jgi:hypothetical protein